MAALEIREGFLCPVCMKDLGTVAHLQSHFEEEHSEDKDVLDQLKGLFDKAKKRILKKEREESESSSYSREEKTNVSEIPNSKDTYLQWDQQELGATRPHTDYFKRMRDTRIDRCVIETNKLLIRMDKLLGPDLPSDPGKRKEGDDGSSSGLVLRAFNKAKTLATVTESVGKMAKNLLLETRVEYDEDDNPFEKAVVPWQVDSEAQSCVDCARRFTVTRRRHHCRLCGGIMCKNCSQFLPFEYARKLTNPSFQYEGRGFHRSNSNSSLNSMFSPDGEQHIRTCTRCRALLERRDMQMQQRNTKPLIVQLYEKMKHHISETDRLLKHFIKMAGAIRAGETTYGLDDANMLRVKIMKLYESIESLSKRIMQLGHDNQLEPPSAAEIQLQNKVRLYARNYLQDNLMGLQALPTAEEYGKIKEQRRQEIQQQIETEKQAAVERGRLARLKELREDKSAGSTSPVLKPMVLEVRTHKREGSQGFVQDEGWKPAEVTHGANDDPMVQQMNNIKGYIKQAKQADRWDEVQMLGQNLKELQRMYWLEKEKSQRSSLQSPLQDTATLSKTHPSEFPVKTQPNVSSQPAQNMRSELSPKKVQGQASSQRNVQKPTGSGDDVTTPTSTNPFDDEYDEERVNAYLVKKQNKN